MPRLWWIGRLLSPLSFTLGNAPHCCYRLRRAPHQQKSESDSILAYCTQCHGAPARSLRSTKCSLLSSIIPSRGPLGL
ncbi:hypothetical protein B0J11DRAFT_101076 [Dendryphion nanum]|uniref:Secreted protein n=1 Tax=Dendryphion nanum TaxID=256645 RepID=A0A9P9IEE2_9PLEO|nr:hypothetical protein B0J11DRAFT_101076 [Dendryphion nanum]